MVETARWAGLRLCAALALVALVPVACGGGEESEPSPQEQAVRVGAFNFPESEIIAEIYAQALEARDIPVERLGAIGTREIVHPALEQDFVDVVPEYAGTMLSFVSLGENEPTFDSHATVTELRETLGPRGMIVLDPASAQNKNVVVVRTSFAAEHGLYGVSDLAPIADTLTFGGPAECPERPFCLIGLRETYGLEFEQFVPLPSSAVVADSLELAEIDVGLMFTTDPAMIDENVTALVDDRDLQPAENVVPVVRWDSYVQWGPELGEALNDVSSRLGTADLGLLNLRAQQVEADIAELARLWLES